MAVVGLYPQKAPLGQRNWKLIPRNGLPRKQILSMMRTESPWRWENPCHVNTQALSLPSIFGRRWRVRRRANESCKSEFAWKSGNHDQGRSYQTGGSDSETATGKIGNGFIWFSVSRQISHACQESLIVSSAMLNQCFAVAFFLQGKKCLLAFSWWVADSRGCNSQLAANGKWMVNSWLFVGQLMGKANGFSSNEVSVAAIKRGYCVE